MTHMQTGTRGNKVRWWTLSMALYTVLLSLGYALLPDNGVRLWGWPILAGAGAGALALTAMLRRMRRL